MEGGEEPKRPEKAKVEKPKVTGPLEKMFNRQKEDKEAEEKVI